MLHTSLEAGVGAAGMGCREAALMLPAPLQASISAGPFGEEPIQLGVEDHSPLHTVLPVWGHAFVEVAVNSLEPAQMRLMMAGHHSLGMVDYWVGLFSEGIQGPPVPYLGVHMDPRGVAV